MAAAKNNITKFRKTLFWDANPDKLDLEKNAQYIIERIADFGNDNEASWVLNFYNRKLLKAVINKSRCLRPRTKALWQLLLKTS